MLLDLLESGGRLARPPSPPASQAAPTPGDLDDVAAGLRDFQPVHREWCISEAMIRSHFQRNSAELEVLSDAELARLIVAG